MEPVTSLDLIFWSTIVLATIERLLGSRFLALLYFITSGASLVLKVIYL